MAKQYQKVNKSTGIGYGFYTEDQVKQYIQNLQPHQKDAFRFVEVNQRNEKTEAEQKGKEEVKKQSAQAKKANKD